MHWENCTTLQEHFIFSSSRTLTHRPRTVHALAAGGARGVVGVRAGDGPEGAHRARAVEVGGGADRRHRTQERVARRERTRCFGVVPTERVAGAILAGVVGHCGVRGVRPPPRGTVAGGEAGGGSRCGPEGIQCTARARVAPDVVLVRPWQTATAGPPVGPGGAGVARAIHSVAAQHWRRCVGGAIVLFPHVAPGPSRAAGTGMVEFPLVPIVTIARHVGNRLRRAEGLCCTIGYVGVPLAPAVRGALFARPRRDRTVKASVANANIARSGF